ncbi:MAG: PilZ domain-containing protein [Desulfobacterales bacterium]|nr:PilZ domain-containing protein [Desulfobacterales bacterium]MDJ0913687.1 PilZ domain-containing protein [Desulfobacterales bacterium]
MKEEKRKHERVDSLHLSYVLIDEDHNIIKQSMGRTLNVSETGILLETHFPIDQEHLVLLTIGLKNDLMDIKGEVIYSRPGHNDKYETGINFIEIDQTALKTLKKFINAFLSK